MLLFTGQLKLSAYMNYGLLTVHGKLMIFMKFSIFCFLEACFFKSAPFRRMYPVLRELVEIRVWEMLYRV